MRKERVRKKKSKAAGWKKRKRGGMEKGEEDAGEERAKMVVDKEDKENPATEEMKVSVARLPIGTL